MGRTTTTCARRSTKASPARCAPRSSWTGARAARRRGPRASSVAEGVALVDYGAGNLHSVHNALIAAGAERVAVTSDPAIVRGARRIVLPGVGSFKACADGLWAIPGLVETIEERVIARGVPFLGVCVGMQLLASRGHEHGSTEGLGWIAGEVRAIEPADATIKVPHMGWNEV